MSALPQRTEVQRMLDAAKAPVMERVIQIPRRKRAKTVTPVTGQRLRSGHRWYAVQRLDATGWWTVPGWLGSTRVECERKHDETPECGRTYQERKAARTARIVLIEFRQVTR